MKRRLSVLFALLSALLLGGFDYAPYEPDWENQGYYNCRDTVDCVALQPPCGNLRAFNRTYAPIVDKWYAYQKTFMGCVNPPQNTSYSPICSTAKKCIMSAPGLNAPKKDDPAYCDLPEDCSVVLGKCGRPVAVNNDNAWNTAADPDSFSTCSFVDDRLAGPVSCKQHLCTIQLYKPGYAPDNAARPAPTDKSSPVQ